MNRWLRLRWLHALVAIALPFLVFAGGAAVADPGLDVRPANPTCVAPPRPGVGSDVGITFQPMFTFLTLTNSAQVPMVLRQSPANPSIWYLVERGGVILRVDDAAKTSSTLLDISSKVHVAIDDGNDEGGVLGMALHPQFATNGVIYVYYTAALDGFACAVTLSRFQSFDGGMTIDPRTETVLLSVPKTTTHHHAGTLEFGPDGMLYVTIGDDLQGFPAQDPNSKLGKVLRLDVDGGEPYGIPADNPFASGGGAPEIWAAGFRNPFRFSFDRTTGDLWLADVGNVDYEEIDKVTRGGNYGWPYWEGFWCRLDPSCNSITTKIDPIYAYDHSSPPCAAVIGGYLYRGSIFPELAGKYVYSDYCHFDVRALFSDAGGPIYSLTIGQTTGAFRSFAEDKDGELYALRTREVDKLVRSTTPPAPFPQHLSETGCVDAADATKPAAGLIPYTVNAPLWSDGAAKDRWMALPDGKTIAVQADGDWNFPIGTVLMKQFKLGGTPIETRLFVRHDDGGWAGYSYEWNAAGTDADLLSADGKTKPIGDQNWHYPSRSECLSCHTEIAGYSLGPTTAQLNGDFHYLSTDRTANQLETIDHIGLLDTPPDSSQKISVWEGTLDQRARSYLQANCAHCHAPGGTAQASIDFRFVTPLAQTHLCGAVPGQGDLGVPGAQILAPGDPSKSVMSLRVHDLGANRMPPLATSVVDPFGTGLLDAWIRSWVPAGDGSCTTACSDGIDNDGDGKIDFPDDPGCESAMSTKENPRCDDGIDNDGDGKIDWDGGPGGGTPDPECVGKPYRDGERKASCGIGAELVGALLVLSKWRRARVGRV